MITAVALCAVGAEKALSNELRKLEFTILEGGFGRVRFKTDLEGLYLALMALRTADRVLIEAARYPAEDFDALFNGARAVRWEDYLRKGRTVVITKVRSRASKLSAETSIQSVVHKAIAERLCEAWSLRRLDDLADADSVRVYVEKDTASLLLDVSGDPLFRRGYRVDGGAAPLRETTAAALLLLSGWKRAIPLYDPFCGSGTFCAEAALYAWDAAPGLGRGFALSDLAIADQAIERKVRAALSERVDFSRVIRIRGSDADSRAVSFARANMERAVALAAGGSAEGPAADHMPVFSVQEMHEARAPWDEGLVLANPPYGERLGDRAEAERLYREMSCLRTSFPGWKMGVITDHPGFESHFGYAASSVREITNGALNSYFYFYDPNRSRPHVDRHQA